MYHKITKKDIRESFSGYVDCYLIETIKRGKAYKITYYNGFHSNNIMCSLLRHNICNWDPLKQTFFVSTEPKLIKNCLHYNIACSENGEFILS